MFSAGGMLPSVTAQVQLQVMRRVLGSDHVTSKCSVRTGNLSRFIILIENF